MSYNLENYKYLWDGSAKGWVLLAAPELVGGHCIFNELNSSLLHVEDEHLNMLLCQRMRDAGCKIIGDIPKRNIPIPVEREE